MINDTKDWCIYVYLIGYFCEFLLFFYYAEMDFCPRRNRIIRIVFLFCGYMFLGYAGLQNRADITLILFFLVNYALLTFCYRVSRKNAICYCLFLDVLTVAAEYVIQYSFGINRQFIWDYHSPGEFADSLLFMFSSERYPVGISFAEMDIRQVLLVSVSGFLVFLTGILFLKRFTSHNKTEAGEIQPLLAAVPLLSMICMLLLMSAGMQTSVFLFICLVFLAINFLAFYINTQLGEQNRKLKNLLKESGSNKEMLAEYRILSEKYENTKIMRHDFRRQLDILKDLIEEDNTQAREFIQQIQFSQRQMDYAKYTDNRILNILLAQKVRTCHESGIEIHIYSDAPVLAFLSEIDTVAVFSNLLDNAIEAAALSEQKEIYVDLYTVNNTYSAVKIENSVEKEPLIVDGQLLTLKADSENHGIGIKSVNQALKKYNSMLNWSYDSENKFFRAMILIHVPERKIEPPGADFSHLDKV